MEDRLQVGVIASTHGIRGEVKVFPTTDNASRFESIEEVILDTGKEDLLLTITSVKYFKKFAILKFKQFNDINEIEKYKGKSLYVAREQAVPLGENEYYIGDLIDMEVFLEDESRFGVITDVMETGANDVYVIETAEGKEVLIPAIRQCILQVDVKENRMKIHLLPGLAD